MKNILWVVCHPDDESIWVGSLLSELNSSKGFKSTVICLSGGDQESPRVQEFKKAMAHAGIYNYWLNSLALRKATEPLPPIDKILEEGLRALGCQTQDFDLVVTHSPYGDEQLAPHHQQAYLSLFEWAQRRKVSFGYFSPLAMPLLLYRSLLDQPKRIQTLHCIGAWECLPDSKFEDMQFANFKFPQAPKYFLQFYSSSEAKFKMLASYVSIGLEKHSANYAAFSSSVENIYLQDSQGMEVFRNLLDIGMSFQDHKLFPLGLKPRTSSFKSRLKQHLKNYFR